jgi:hypothetical protein
LAIGNTKLPKKRAAGKKRQRQKGKKAGTKKRRQERRPNYAEKASLDKRQVAGKKNVLIC